MGRIAVLIVMQWIIQSSCDNEVRVTPTWTVTEPLRSLGCIKCVEARSTNWDEYVLAYARSTFVKERSMHGICFGL